MAIKDFEPNANFKINVFMKNNFRYLGCDITSKPLSKTETILSFWHNDKVRMVSVQDVEYFEIYEEAS